MGSYSNKILPQATRKSSNKQPKLTPKATRKRTNKTQLIEEIIKTENKQIK